MDDKFLSKAREHLTYIEGSLPLELNAADVSLRAKIPFKVIAWQGVLVWRIAELSKEALRLFSSSSYITCCLVTRSVMETAAMLHSLNGRVESIVTGGRIGDIDEWLMRGLLGDREGASLHDSLNVLTAINRVNRDLNGFRQGYDELSEYAHPNWRGTHGSFVKIDPDNRRLCFGQYIDHPPFDFISRQLAISLSVARTTFDSISENMQALVLACEAALDSDAT